MEFSGSCYCGALRYQASGEPLFKALCHCKQCQMFSGGMAALLIGMPKANFSYTQGKPAIADNRYSDANAHREFCAECGTHILAVSDASPDMVSIKAGTMDDSSWVNVSLNCWVSTASPWSPADNDLPGAPRNPAPL